MRHAKETEWNGAQCLNNVAYIFVGLMHVSNLKSVKKNMGYVDEMCLRAMILGIDEEVYYPSHFVYDVVMRMTEKSGSGWEGIRVGKELRNYSRNGVFVFGREMCVIVWLCRIF